MSVFSTKRAFTLIEVVVVTAIFVLMAGLVLFNFRSFQSTRSLDATAQELATTVREAQIYGISVVGQEEGSEFVYPRYGIHVSNIDSNQEILFFADTDPMGGDRVYTPGADQLLATYTIEDPIALQNICTSQTGQTESNEGSGFRCYRDPDDPGVILNEIDFFTAMFERPDPEPYIYDSEYNIIAGEIDPESGLDSRAYARIDLVDTTSGETTAFGKSVYIWRSGQVGAANPYTDVVFAKAPPPPRGK